MRPNASSTLRVAFSSRRMVVLFLLGFSSGLPRLLVFSTLQYMMNDRLLPQDVIAAVVAVGLPYTFKFLWAPAVDRFQIPGLGRRRGWLLVTQLALIATLVALGVTDPVATPAAFYLLATAVAIAAATQDIVVDAYSIDVLAPHERGLGAAVSVMGYRTAMLVAGSGALLIADVIGWTSVYCAMAGLVGVGLIGTLLAEEPGVQAPSRRFGQVAVDAVTELFGRLGWRVALLVLAFAVTYELAEQVADVVLASFYRQDIGFTKTEIALINKLMGFAAIIVGGTVGGLVVAAYGARRTLVWFGVFQAMTHVAYIAVSYAGHNLLVFAIALAIENMSVAMATSAFVATLYGLCNVRVGATQYALLTSLAGLGGRALGGVAGDLVGTFGYREFFAMTMTLAIPGIVLGYFAAGYSSTEVARRPVDS